MQLGKRKVLFLILMVSAIFSYYSYFSLSFRSLASAEDDCTCAGEIYTDCCTIDEYIDFDDCYCCGHYVEGNTCYYNESTGASCDGFAGFCVFGCNYQNEDSNRPSCDDSCGLTVLKTFGSAVCTDYNGWQCDYSYIYVCNSTQHNCGEFRSCGGVIYYCIYDSSNGWHWSTSLPSNFCCSDSGCYGYDSATHTKMVCDCPDHTKCSHPSTDDDYTCKALPSCSDNSECDPNYCCADDPNGPQPGTGKCVSKGIYSANPRYLCDPPDWVPHETTKQVKSSSKSIFELLFDFFSKIFS